MNTPPPLSTDQSQPHHPPHYSTAYSSPYYGQPPSHDSGFLGSLDPFRILRVLRKKWLVILLTFVFAGIATTYYLLTTTRIYQASSLIELSVRRPRIMNQQAAVIEDPNAVLQSEEIFNTRLEKFKGRTIREATITHFRKQHPDCKLDDKDFGKMFDTCLDLTLLRRTRLVKIEFTNPDPKFAVEFCNAFTEAAEASVYDENRIASDAAVTWLEAQAGSQRTEVEKADAALLKYRQENKIDVLESQRKTIENALMDFTKYLDDIESRETMEKDLLNSLSTIELKPENVGKLPASIPRSDEIKGAMEKWLGAVAERDALLTKYTSKHPEVEAKNAMVKVYRDQALDMLNQAKATSASNLELFRKQAESLRQKKAEQTKSASDLELQINERRTHLSALERTRDASDTAFRGILQRIQEARMAADENTATVKIVDHPSMPEKPIKPKPLRIVAIAIFMSLVIGTGLALVTDNLEDHITGPQDVELGMGIKVLGMIPHVQHGLRRDIATASLNQRFSQITEAFAGLRTMLDSVQYKDQSKVILVASSMPEEGKTITSCNLAIACAKNGQRVLLIDFDLRRPRLVGIFPMPPEGLGLLNYLSTPTSEKPASLTYSTDCPNLTLIASRPVKGASPAELVGSEKVIELLAWARANFDRVIIDAPPLGLVSDALVLAGMADCVLIMTRSEKSRKRTLSHTLRRFQEAGVKVISAIINDVDFSSGSAYYSPYYHYYTHYQAYPPEDHKKE